MPPYRQPHIEQYPADGAGQEEGALQGVPLVSPVDERQERQEGHGGALDRQADQLVGEKLQRLVVGEKIPLRLDVGRGLVRVGLDERLLREEDVGVEENDGGE